MSGDLKMCSTYNNITIMILNNYDIKNLYEEDKKNHHNPINILKNCGNGRY